MNNIIYIGSTNSTDVFHVGMTGNGRSPELRWQDADYRGKLPYVPKRVAFFNVGDLRDEPIHTYILKDANVYSVKEEQGIRSDEIFRVDANNPAEYLQALVEEAIKYNKTGIRPVDKFFSPRPHQAWVNAQVLDKFDGTKTVVQPLNLAARFGKTLQGLDLFKKSGLRTMVMAGYWLAANNSFVSTIEDRFDITSDITIIKPDYQQYVDALATGNRVFIDLSLHTDVEKVDQRLIDELAKSGSFIYVDEADFGAWTEGSTDTLDQFVNAGNNLVVVATGTNIDRALIGKGEVEPVISVSYLDLVEAKRGEGILFDCEPAGPKEAEVLESIRSNPEPWVSRLSNIVEVACLNLSVNDALVDAQNDLTEERRINMAKIFAKRNAHISRAIIKQLFFDEDMNEDVFGMYEERFTGIEHPAAMMFIPGQKKDVDLIAKIGKEVAPDYNWVALHGDNYTNRTAERMVEDAIENGGGYRTVIISCSMGARSFSVPNIVAVVNAVDGGSLASAVQRGSRCFTPGLGKEVGLLVNYSFNTDRSSSFEADLISSVLRYDYEDTESAIRRVYALANFLKKDEEGYLISLTEAEFSEYVTSPENLENITSAAVDFDRLLKVDNLAELLAGVTPQTMDKEWQGVIEKARTYLKRDNNKGEVDEEKKAIRDFINKVNTVIQTTGNVFWLAPTAKTFREALVNICSDQDKNQSYFELVGVAAEVVLYGLLDYLPEHNLDLLLMTKGQRKVGFDAVDHTTGLFEDLLQGLD